jgi:hypothetical protein
LLQEVHALSVLILHVSRYYKSIDREYRTRDVFLL